MRFPREILEALDLPDATIIATLPNGRIRVVSKLPPGRRWAELLLKAYLLEATPCDETCIRRVIRRGG